MAAGATSVVNTAAGTAFSAAGEEHGLSNPGTVPARYLVFEFHA